MSEKTHDRFMYAVLAIMAVAFVGTVVSAILL